MESEPGRKHAGFFLARSVWVICGVAIMHLCLECGLDLARVRPGFDQRLGLRLVICPRCRTACERRRHPIRGAWRDMNRAAMAIAVIFVQCMMGVMLAIASLGAISAFIDDDADRLLTVVTFLLIPIATGAWLRAGFAHLGWWIAWIGWALVVPLITAAIIGACFVLDVDAPLVDLRYAGNRQALGPIAVAWAATCIAIPLGIPLGNGLRIFARARHKTRWSRRRRKRRQEYVAR